MTPTSAGAKVLSDRTAVTRTGIRFARKYSRKARRQLGLTLFELLIALALISLMALLVSGGIGKSSPHFAVRLASEQMLADIKRARLEADASNAPVTIAISDAGYEIDALGLSRALPQGVVLVQPNGDKDAAEDIIIGPGHWIKAYEVTLAKGDARSTISIEPVTRRVALQ